MTAGVALTVAAVVVANPIIAPHSDVQIPAVALSAGSDPSGTGMLDAAFLNAIAPAPPEPTTPFTVLKQLLASLAADVTSFGKSAIVDAFVAGVATVTQPALTAASSPYLGPVVDPAGLPETEGGLLLDPDSAATSPSVIFPTGTIVDPALVIKALLPAAQQAVAAFAADARFVSDELVAAAFATGALVASEPELIYDTLRALVAGDLEVALQSAVKAVSAPLGPPVMVLDALRTVVERHLAELFAPRAVRSVVAPSVSVSVTAGAATAGPVSAPVTTAPSRVGRKQLGRAVAAAVDSDEPPAVRVASPAAAAASLGGTAAPDPVAPNSIVVQRKVAESARGPVAVTDAKLDHPVSHQARVGHGRTAAGRR
jgi:hypothetical protein